jgi:hypothetical protein
VIYVSAGRIKPALDGLKSQIRLRLPLVKKGVGQAWTIAIVSLVSVILWRCSSGRVAERTVDTASKGSTCGGNAFCTAVERSAARRPPVGEKGKT